MSSASINGISNNGAPSKVTPQTEVSPKKAKRRSFTGKQKLEILEETDCLDHGALGAYLRRRGIYSASLSSWRKQRQEGRLNSESSLKRGRKPKSAEARELEKLQRENEKLKIQLKHADAIITAQKKLCEIYSQYPENGENK